MRAITMRTRPFRPSDVEEISRIWEENQEILGNTSLPSREKALGDVVIEDDDGTIVAYGLLQIFSIAHMFLNQKVSVRKRREAMGLLLAEAIDTAKALDVGKIYTFTVDPDYARLIEKHFGFDLVGSPGEMLIREV
jgi:ribosomal protein S18 acetylase RimI-like enzyme